MRIKNSGMTFFTTLSSPTPPTKSKLTPPITRDSSSALSRTKSNWEWSPGATRSILAVSISPITPPIDSVPLLNTVRCVTMKTAISVWTITSSQMIIKPALSAPSTTLWSIMNVWSLPWITPLTLPISHSSLILNKKIIPLTIQANTSFIWA